MSHAWRWLLAAAALALVGCARPRPPASVPRKPPGAAATAGTQDGICREHGVLEAVCTKCNPALIPVFQAKGDWCPEHGFPESICPICHPERGGRPAAEVAPPEAPSGKAEDGAHVRFKSERSAELAGIETSPARAVTSQESVVVFGRIVPDAKHEAHVNVRAAGVLTEITADVGAVVRAGAALALVTSTDAGNAVSRSRVAQAKADGARTEYQREKRLHDERVTSDRGLLDARTTLEQAEAELAGARSEVAMLGGAGAGGRYSVVAPIAGMVVERSASVGQLVHPEDALFTIVDPSQLRVELDVPESRMADARVGTTAEVEEPGGRVVTVRLDFVSPMVDPRTRTVLARAPISNVDASLAINARVKARLLRPDEAREGASVPAGAVQRIGGDDVVFVRREPSAFELVRVEVLERSGESAIVRSRLVPGDQVATTGSFLLKTEVLKASIGSGCCELD